MTAIVCFNHRDFKHQYHFLHFKIDKSTPVLTPFSLQCAICNLKLFLIWNYLCSGSSCESLKRYGKLINLCKQ